MRIHASNPSKTAKLLGIHSKAQIGIRTKQLLGCEVFHARSTEFNPLDHAVVGVLDAFALGQEHGAQGIGFEFPFGRCRLGDELANISSDSNRSSKSA